MAFNQEAHDALTLTDKREYYKPFRYPQFYTLSVEHQDMQWTRRHIKTLNEDIADFKAMSLSERAPLEAMLVYFTLVDVDVASSWFKNIAKFYHHPELLMNIARIVDREATHTDVYDMLPEQFGIDKHKYSEILKINAIAEQHTFMSTPALGTSFWERVSTLVKHIAGEGVGIYGVFLPLVNYSLHGRMKSTGLETVSWSSRDENHHVKTLTELVRLEVEEDPNAWTGAVKEALRNILKICVENTDAVIDYFYSLGEIKHLTADEVKQSLRQIANARSEAISLGVLYPEVVELPIVPAMALLFNGSELANFFETSNTAYGFYSGEWEYPKEGEVIPDWELAKTLLES